MRTRKSSYPIILLCFLIGMLPLNAAGQQQNKLDLRFSSGYQSENFGWSIAGDLSGQNPNVYSELKWSHLREIANLATLNWQFSRRFYLLVSYDHNFIISGKVSDTDYGSDNRSTPIYNGDFQDKKGYAGNETAGLGFSAIRTRKINLAIATGFTLFCQSLYLTGLNGQNPDLNTRYFTNWKGAFVSGDFIYKICKKVGLRERINYSQLNYNARADWNLIEQFAHPISYRDNAAGYNILATSAVFYQLDSRFTINLSAGYSHAQTGIGVDKLYLVNGGQEETQFNGANGECYQLTAGINFNL